jgi:hypothetical protein
MVSVLLLSRLADLLRPILTPKSVLPLFFIVGVIFAPIGGVLIWASSLVRLSSIIWLPGMLAHLYRRVCLSGPRNLHRLL